MYEIGDDMLILGSEKDRLTLVENRELLNMAKIGQASKPVDLMTYEPEDERAKHFLLEGRSAPGNTDCLQLDRRTAFAHAETGRPRASRRPHVCSDGCTRPECDGYARGRRCATGEPASTVSKGHQVDRHERCGGCSNGDGSSARSRECRWRRSFFQRRPKPAVCPRSLIAGSSATARVRMAQRHLMPTRSRGSSVRLTVDGVDEIPAHKDFSVKVTGKLRAHSNLSDNRRFVEPTDR